MADGAPPWADQRYSTPPPNTAPVAPAPDTGIPGAAQYSTPPAGSAPAGPGNIQWDPTWFGTLNRFMGGVATGAEDPFAGVGLDIRDPLGMAQSQTPAGRVGRAVGNVISPAWEFLRPVQAVAGAVRYGGPLARAGARLAGHAVEGAIAGGVMPGEHRGRQAEQGAVISTILGAPGAAIRAAGFPSLTAAAREVGSHIFGVSHVLDAARQLSVPDFNRVWYRYILHPIRDLIPGGAKVPDLASRDSMAKVEKQVGQAIDKSTAGMMLDARPGAPGRPRSTANMALSNSMRVSEANLLAQSQGARDQFRSTINNLVITPLINNGWRLGAAQFRDVTSNLAAAIRDIRPDSAATRALRHELEQFRMRMFDNSFGGDRKGWARARDAWRKFAIARDSSPSTGEGHFTPDQMSATIHQREALGAPSLRGAHQKPVQAAQSALLLPGRAAANQIAGRTPFTTGRVGAIIPPGVAGAAARGNDPDVVLPPVTITAQPPTTRSLTP